MAGRIEDYAIVGDMQSAALICTDGSVDWLCLPRFDSDGVLRRAARHAGPRPLADRARGGAGGGADGSAAAAGRRYAGDTLILETQWETPDGAVRVTDFMPPRGDESRPCWSAS